MKVNNRHMYHFRPIGYYDDVWKVGNEFVVDDTFESHIKRITCMNDTLIHVGEFNGTLATILERHRDKEYKYLSNNEARFLFGQLERIIKNENIMVRELALEDFRKKYCPELPSRFNSIWVTGKQSIKHWERIFQKDPKYSRELLELELTGNLFKSSEDFLPDDGVSYQQSYDEAERYWKPDFTGKYDPKKVEYLFQGQVRVRGKLK